MQLGNEPSIAPQRAARQAAAYWLATLSDASCSDTERQRFLQWLRSSTDHVDEFLRISTLARRLGRRELWPDDSVEELIAAARSSTNVTALAHPPESAAHRAAAPRWPWAMAASIVGVITLVALFNPQERIAALLSPSYRTAVGEQRSITLDDGSVVELNSKSQLHTHFTRSLRAVDLSDGEAIFHVTKDPSRPFRVRTGATDIIVVGTAFNVNANAARTIVTVIEGRVRVAQRAQAGAADAAQPAEDIDMQRGEQVIIEPAKPPVRVSVPDIDKIISWTKRRLIFEDTPIAAAAAEFARYSSRQVHIEDAELGARPISGVFDATDPASLVQFLASADDVEVRTVADGWHISRKP